MTRAHVCSPVGERSGEGRVDEHDGHVLLAETGPPDAAPQQRRVAGALHEALLESVQQSHFGSQFAFRHSACNFQIEPQMRTVIPHLKPILNAPKLKIEMQIAIKWQIFLSVQQLRKIAPLKRKWR